MSFRKTKVFISGVSSDFHQIRRELDNDLRGDYFDVTVQEHFQGGGGSLLEKLDALILKSQVVIGLVGQSLGEQSSQKECREILAKYPGLADIEGLQNLVDSGCYPSYTQWEIYLSQFHGIDCLLYFDKSLDCQKAPRSISQQQWNFYQHVRKTGKDFRWFDNPGEVYRAVQRDTRSYLLDLGSYRLRPKIYAVAGVLAIVITFLFWRNNSRPVESFSYPKVGAPIEPRFEDIPAIRMNIPDSNATLDFVLIPADQIDSEMVPFWICCSALDGKQVAAIQFDEGEISERKWVGNLQETKRLRDEVSSYIRLGTPRLPTRKELVLAKQILLPGSEAEMQKVLDRLVLSWTKTKSRFPNWSTDIANTHVSDFDERDLNHGKVAKAQFVVPISDVRLSFVNKTNENVFLAATDNTMSNAFKKKFEVNESYDISYPLDGWFSIHLIEIPTDERAEAIAQIYVSRSKANYWNLITRQDKLSLEPVDANMSGMIRVKEKP